MTDTRARRATAHIDARSLTSEDDDGAVFRVLLVEADHELRRAFSRALQRVGFTVTEAQDGLQAQTVLAERADSYFHLVIRDVQMLALDGVELPQSRARSVAMRSGT